MHGDVLADAGGLAGDLAGQLHAANADMLCRISTWEQPLAARMLGLPVSPQQLEQLRREHHQPFLAALTVGNPQHHAPVVDVVHAQGDDFEHAQTGGIGGDQHGTHFLVWDGREKPRYLVDAEHCRKFARLLLEWQLC